MTPPILSALVVVHNEEKKLKACLEHLTFADEIVVVLDRCTDKSEDIATQFNATLVKGAWPQEGSRRHAGLMACKGQWVVEIDADEHVPLTLAQEIRQTIEKGREDYYPLRIDNYIGRTLVRYGWGAHFGTSETIRLYRHHTKKWGVESVHPSVHFTGDKGKPLPTPVLHYVDENISDMLQRFNRYTEARAQDLRVHGVSETLSHNVRRLFSRFFKCYVMRQGYREKGYGLLIALLAALYPLVSYLKATLESSASFNDH